MNTKVITAGEKLKEIRKKYKIKQYELSGNELTRNMISMIETDKAGLTKNTAEILIQNIYKICNERAMECDVTLEYLLESAECQAKKICDEFIELLDYSPKKIFEKDFEKELNEIQILLDKYKLKKEKLIIYFKLSELFDASNDFYKAYIYSLRAFENYSDLFNNSQLIDLIIRLTYYCNNLKKYKETLNFSKLAYIYVSNIPEDKAFKIKFNTIKAYKDLKDYDSALKEMEEIEQDFKEKLNLEPNKKINIMILKANCLNEKFSYIDALQMNKKILSLTEDNIEMQLVTLCNMMEIYIKMNDSKNIKEYIDRCIFNLKKYEKLETKKYSSEIYEDIGLACHAINKFEMSKNYLSKALMEAKKYNKIDVTLVAIEKLLSIAINTNCRFEVDDLKNQLIELILRNLLPINNTLIFKFIKYYNDLGDSESINDIINFAESSFAK